MKRKILFLAVFIGLILPAVPPCVTESIAQERAPAAVHAIGSMGMTVGA